MDIKALENSLKRQVISPVYLFYGEETYLRDQYLGMFKSLLPDEYRDFNMDIIDGRDTSMESIIGMAATMPFLADKRLVIVKNADIFKAKRKNQKKGTNLEQDENGDKPDPSEDILINYLENPVDSTCLIFCTDSVDRKRKIYKRIEKNGQVVQFAQLKGKDITEWINRTARRLGKTIEPKAVAGLVAAVGNNLCQLRTELEKLACYVQGNAITAADVEMMVSKTVELSIFELVDAVGNRNYSKALRLAREMVFFGEPVIRILYMVARQFRLLLQSKSLLASGVLANEMAGLMQVHPFVAQKCIKQAGNFSLGELKLSLEKVLKADADIKGGKQEAVLALELLIIALCEKR
ncbi:DNA polymerase III subunit delta [Phosphitispora sp. TUW77]|uniref:DNA polymerase III subunit delta n=1 Tax=Phosphitispora sp. TUW77 TaxID=3152361 RepID=UPI003AB386CF